MNFKRFFGNSAAYAVGNLCHRVSSFLLIPVYTHTMNQKDFGRLNLLLGSVIALVPLMNFGVQDSLIRYAASDVRENKGGELLGSSLLVTILASLLIGIVFLAGSSRWFEGSMELDDSVFSLLLLVCAAAMLQNLFVLLQTYFRALEQSLSYAIFGIVCSFGILGLTSFFLFGLKWGIAGVLQAQILVYGILSAWLCLKFFNMTRFAISSSQIRRQLQYAVPIFATTFAFVVIGDLGLYMVAQFRGLEESALYALSWRLVKVITIALTIPWQMALEPFVFANLHQADIKGRIAALLEIYLWAFVFFEAVCMVSMRFAIEFMVKREELDQYFDSLYILLFMLPIPCLSGLYYYFRALVHVGEKTKHTAKVVWLVSPFAVALSYLFIRWLGVYGAALSFSISMLVICLAIARMAKNVYAVPLRMGRILLPCAFALGLIFFYWCMLPLSKVIYASAGVGVPALILTGAYFLGLMKFPADEEARMKPQVKG